MIYPYKCPTCGQEHEMEHKLAETPVFECPDCKTRMVRQIASRVGAHFRGTGFYRTDYSGANPSHIKKAKS
jgi:putative FmdB family regulatory protein